MDILDLLRSDGSIVINKRLAHAIGMNEAILYSELVSLFKYWSDREQLKDGEWFFCTVENLQENTTLKKDVQARAISNLEKKHGLIETKRMGIPSKRYFRITNGILNLIDNKQSQKPITGNDNGSENHNEENNHDQGSNQNEPSNPRHSQQSQKPITSESKSSSLEEAKSATNNTRTNNTLINNTNNLVNKDVDNSYLESRITLTDEEENQCYELEKEYRLQGLSQEVIDRVRAEVDEKREHIKNYPAYYRSCLDNTLYKSKLKHGHIDMPYPHLGEEHPLNYNWLND